VDDEGAVVVAELAVVGEVLSGATSVLFDGIAVDEVPVVGMAVDVD
jgi:hypothetical protein